MFSNKQQYEEVLDKSQFEAVEATTDGPGVFDEPISEEQVYYPTGLVISEKSGGANELTVNKVEEDGTETTIIDGYNLGADESVALSEIFGDVFLPRLEGGTNLSFVAGSDTVNVTLMYYPDEIL